MKWKLLVFLGLLIGACFLTKEAEVKDDEIGIVFSYWDGHSFDTFYKPGTYKISMWRAFQCARIIEKTEGIEIGNSNSEIKISFKPIPEKNFEILRIYGLDYGEKFVRPILEAQKNKLQDLKSDRERVKALRGILETNDSIKKYLRITKLELKQG